jgi:hypothetical protein
VDQSGLYTIHTLVYDPATLDLSGVQVGVTTGFDVNGLLLQGGGAICASLDVQGAPFIVVGPFLCALLDIFRDAQGLEALSTLTGSPDGVNDSFLRAVEADGPFGDVTLFPNPTRDVLNVELELYMDGRVELAVFDLLGREALPVVALNSVAGTDRTSIDVAGLLAGTYILRFTSGDRVVTQQFMKVN